MNFLARALVFALTCSILFATTKLAFMSQKTSNQHFSLLKPAILFAVYFVVSINYIVSITNWFFILTS